MTEQNTAGNTGGGNLEDDAVPASGSEVKEASATGRAVLEVLGAFAILGVKAMQEYTELRSFLDTIVNSKLPELWQGAGAEAYITRYQELAPSQCECNGRLFGDRRSSGSAGRYRHRVGYFCDNRTERRDRHLTQ